MVTGASGNLGGTMVSAVTRLTESFSAAYKTQEINVNTILPGTMDTPKNREAMP